MTNHERHAPQIADLSSPAIRNCSRGSDFLLSADPHADRARADPEHAIVTNFRPACGVARAAHSLE